MRSFSREAAELHHFGLPLADEQMNLADPDGPPYMMYVHEVQDPHRAAEQEWGALMVPNDAGEMAPIYVPSVLERFTEEYIEAGTEFFEKTGTVDAEIFYRVPSAFGDCLLPDPIKDHARCCSGLPTFDYIRIWALWPLEREQAVEVWESMQNLYENTDWINHLRTRQLPDFYGFTDADEAEDVATVTVPDDWPENLRSPIEARQKHATELLSALESFQPKEPLTRKLLTPELSPEIQEVWERLLARREAFIARAPRVFPEFGQNEGLFTTWP